MITVSTGSPKSLLMTFTRTVGSLIYVAVQQVLITSIHSRAIVQHTYLSQPQTQPINKLAAAGLQTNRKQSTIHPTQTTSSFLCILILLQRQAAFQAARPIRQQRRTPAVSVLAAAVEPPSSSSSRRDAALSLLAAAGAVSSLTVLPGGSAAAAAASCDFISSPSGLQYCDVKEGEGPEPAKGSLIR
jgi:hypothetical protein